MIFFRRKKHKVGLALGSGSARGLAHIGVIKALTEEKIAIDMIAGSSIGALVGACFANGTIKDLEKVTLNMDFKNLLKLADPQPFLLSKGFIAGKKVEELLISLIGDVEFKDLNIPFLVAATDAQTGDEIIIKAGSVSKAVRASLSIPGVFTPAKFENRFIIDGGIASPMPVDILKREGMNFIIASNVAKKPRIRSKTVDAPYIFETIIGAIDIMGYQIVKMKLKEANMVITPEVDQIALLEFYRGKETIEAGYKKTKEEILRNKLKKQLRIT